MSFTSVVVWKAQCSFQNKNPNKQTKGRKEDLPTIHLFSAKADSATPEHSFSSFHLSESISPRNLSNSANKEI
jgi:hypothetical protein